MFEVLYHGETVDEAETREEAEEIIDEIITDFYESHSTVRCEYEIREIK